MQQAKLGGTSEGLRPGSSAPSPNQPVSRSIRRRYPNSGSETHITLCPPRTARANTAAADQAIAYTWSQTLPRLRVTPDPGPAATICRTVKAATSRRRNKHKIKQLQQKQQASGVAPGGSMHHHPAYLGHQVEGQEWDRFRRRGPGSQSAWWSPSGGPVLSGVQGHPDTGARLGSHEPIARWIWPKARAGSGTWPGPKGGGQPAVAGHQGGGVPMQHGGASQVRIPTASKGGGGGGKARRPAEEPGKEKAVGS